MMTSSSLILIFLLSSFNLVTGDDNCYDLDDNCPQMSMRGDCFKDKKLQRRCPDSCGMCRTDDENEILKSVYASANTTVWFMKVLGCFLLAAVLVAIIKIRNTGGVCMSKGNMKEKLVIITGATSGIGLDTAFHLALRGAKVVIGCRNLKKGFKVAKDLRNQTGQQMIEVRKLDLMSFDSIRDFANLVTEQYVKVDVLINNAGMYSGKSRTLSADGYESTFQVNYLGHFYLTKLLMSKLKESTPCRIINVVSEEFRKGELDFSNLQGNKNFDNTKAYCNANLALMHFTKQLSVVLKDTGVTINAADPGISCTSLWRQVFPYGWNLTWILLSPYTYLFWKSSSMGAETSYFCSLDRDLESVSGQYFKDCKQETFPDLKDEVGRKLWAVSERLLEPKKLSTLNQAAIKRALNEIVRADANGKQGVADAENDQNVSSVRSNQDSDSTKENLVKQEEEVTEESKEKGNVRNRKCAEDAKEMNGRKVDSKKCK